MTNNTAAKIYEYGSYVLILAATALYFLGVKDIDITLLVLVVAVYMRALMYRSRYKSASEENEELKADLRRAARMLKTENE